MALVITKPNASLPILLLLLHNKKSQSDYGTGCETPHWLQWVAPNEPPKLPLQWTDPQIQLPASSLDHLTCHSKLHPYPISHFATMHWTDIHTHT